MPLSLRYLGALGVICIFATLAGAQDSAKRFLGTWTLLSYERRTSSGEVTHPFGEKPVGQLTYDAQGHMSAQIMHTRRDPFKADRMAEGAPAEKVKAFDTYVAYTGTYTIDESKHLVYHHVAMSMFPNWVGLDQRREYEFSKGQLILRVTNGGGNGSGPPGSVSTLVWIPAGKSR